MVDLAVLGAHHYMTVTGGSCMFSAQCGTHPASFANMTFKTGEDFEFATLPPLPSWVLGVQHQHNFKGRQHSEHAEGSLLLSGMVFNFLYKTGQKFHLALESIEYLSSSPVLHGYYI